MVLVIDELLSGHYVTEVWTKLSEVVDKKLRDELALESGSKISFQHSDPFGCTVAN